MASHQRSHNAKENILQHNFFLINQQDKINTQKSSHVWLTAVTADLQQLKNDLPPERNKNRREEIAHAHMHTISFTNTDHK